MTNLFRREEGERHYDTYDIQRILRVSRSKVQREIRRLNPNRIQHKNQFIYGEDTLFSIMEKILSEKLNTIERDI